MNEKSEAGVPSRTVGRAELAELYSLHAAPLQRLAYLLTSDHELAEDITQHAFIKFYGRFQNLREPSAAAAYLKKTVVNLARGHHRRARVEREYLTRQRQVEDRIEARSIEEHDLVIHALLTLPYRQRAAIVLRFYEDLSEAQAAAVMECSPAAMKSLTARAMSSLRAAMEGTNDG